jgi:hypothetical protein
MTPDELRAAGEFLYGPKWQTPLALALDVDPRSIHNWLSGKHRINKRTEEAIKALKAERRTSIFP